ncbi:MAG: tripartite tricarboxylate transporter substrate binding protein [Pseudomonadota bacterium]
MTQPRRRCLLAGLAAAGAAALPASGWAREALRLVVAYPPGGVSDQVTRALASLLDAQGAGPVVVENRAGAGGAVGLASMARAAPDGRTLCFSAISPLTQSAAAPVGGRPLAEVVVPVIGVMHTPVLLVGTPAFAGRSFGDLLAAARARPGLLRWATSGAGTAGHQVLEQVRRATGIDVTHVPYKGGGPQLNDALAGEFELLSTNVAPLQIDYVRAGRFTPLAVGAPARMPVLAAVPTFAELGCPGANLASLFGLFAPRGTPEVVVRRLNVLLARALAHPALRNRLLSAGNLPAGSSTAEFAAAILAEAQAGTLR